MDAQESKIYLAIIIAVAVVFVIALSFLYAVLKHHKKVLQLERENAKAQVELMEKDRARIAEDLHDDLAPMLAAVRMKINSFNLLNDLDIERLATTNVTIDDIAKRMRSISFDLMPASLKDKGLEKAVLEFINYIGSANSLKIRLIPMREPLKLEEAKVVHLYRIIQEIIHNTVKHARASELIIVLKKENNSLVLLSEDNGEGFDNKAGSQQKTGLGLKSMQNRVNLMKGTLDVKSIPGKTNFMIQIPLGNE